MVKRVVVIGAGANGLTAIKCCRDEGCEVVCYERSEHLGGLWHFTPQAGAGQSSVSRNTCTNLSKEMSCFSDFPVPAHFAPYMHHTKVLEYFHMYADHFNLKGSIRYRTDILSVNKTRDFSTTGRWTLQLKDLNSGEVRTETYDAVMVCSGHHCHPYMPQYPGMGDFQGTITHSNQYKEPRGYEDKTVLVVGIGNSGVDVATDLAKVTRQVYLSSRRSAWVANRVSQDGIPIDMYFGRRSFGWLTANLPAGLANGLIERKMNQRLNHEAFGLRPRHRVGCAHPTLSDELPLCLICGTVILKPNIKTFTKNGVQFEDGTFVDNVDVVVFSTGYEIGFPFLDEDIVSVSNNQVELYKLVFPPHLQHSTLAVIGCIQPVGGSIVAVGEMQCRWATRVWQGRAILPPKDEMWNDIRERRDKMAAQYVPSHRHTIQVPFVGFMDELADLIGCKPNLRRMLLRDPVLAWACIFGACTPIQFRLMGPGNWPGAREAVLKTYDRVRAPLRTSFIQNEPTGLSNNKFLIVLCASVWVLIAYIVTCIFM